MHLEPHPVSGEVELDDVRPAKYRRLDEETLQSRLEVEQFELLPILLWCETDEHGGTDPGWKLAELRSLEDMEDDTEWHDTVSQANDAAYARQTSQLQQDGENGTLHPQQQAEEDDDDDYWASYDRTPGRTPAQKQSPAPPALTAAQAGNRQRSQSELDYYARYGAEVQPAMDSHDPDEEHPEIGQSTLNGGSLLSTQQTDGRVSRPNGDSMFPADAPAQPPSGPELEAPRPISPTSSNSSSVEKLESKATELSQVLSPGSMERAQLAVQQHISTDIKSLFRLAKNSGMEREEFERIVRTELECLPLLEQDE
jgi:hypothetical protein